MAKKNKKKGQTKTKQQVDVSVAQVEEQTEQNGVVVGTPKETETKQADKSKPEKKTDKKKNKVKKPSKTAKKIKETTSELKKVTWPSFLTVVKKNRCSFGSCYNFCSCIVWYRQIAFVVI